MRTLHNPVKIPYRISADFNFRYPNTLFYLVRGLAGKKHNAWDIVIPTGTALHAPERMQVHEVVSGGWRSLRGYGKFIRAISLEDNITQYIFAHLDVVPYPRIGKIWQADEVFAWSGNTGWSTAPHCHWEIEQGNKYIDPKSFKLV